MSDENEKIDSDIESLRTSDDPTTKAILKLLIQVQQTQPKVDSLFRNVVGDSQFKTKGIVDYIQEHDKRLRMLERIVTYGTCLIGIVTFFMSDWGQHFLRMLLKTPPP